MHAAATREPSGSLGLSRRRIFLSSAHAFEGDSRNSRSFQGAFAKTEKKNLLLQRNAPPATGGRGSAIIVAFLSLAALTFVVMAAMFPVWVEIGRFETADADVGPVRAQMASAGFAESVDFRIREGAVIEASSRRATEAVAALHSLTGRCPQLRITGKPAPEATTPVILSHHDPGGSPSRVLTMAVGIR